MASSPTKQNAAKVVDPAFASVARNSSTFIIWRVEVIFVAGRIFCNFSFLTFLFLTGFETCPAAQGFLREILQRRFVPRLQRLRIGPAVRHRRPGKR